MAKDAGGTRVMPRVRCWRAGICDHSAVCLFSGTPWTGRDSREMVGILSHFLSSFALLLKYSTSLSTLPGSKAHIIWLCCSLFPLLLLSYRPPSQSAICFEGIDSLLTSFVSTVALAIQAHWFYISPVGLVLCRLKKIIFYWSVIALQCCVSFCDTMK